MEAARAQDAARVVPKRTWNDYVRFVAPKSDDGFQALELAILFPTVILFALLVVGAGRTFSAKNQVTGAAHSAARAGSIAGPEAAASEADAQALRSLAAGDACEGASVSSTTREWNGQTFLQTTVSCTIRVSDLGLPIHQTVSATSEEVIDRGLVRK